MRATKLVCVVALVVAGCGKPTDVVIPTDKAAWDKELAPALKKLPDEDQKLVAGYLMRQELAAGFAGIFGGASAAQQGLRPGVTIGRAISEQRTWLAEQQANYAAEKAQREARQKEEDALKQKMATEAKAARNAVNNALTVTFLELGFSPSDFRAGRYSDQQTFKIGFENKGDKAIEGVKGEIAFIDLFGKEVGGVTFGVTETIQPGQTYRWSGARDYNEFFDGHRSIRGLKEGKYKTEFRPEAVVFADGTSIKMPK